MYAYGSRPQFAWDQSQGQRSKRGATSSGGNSLYSLSCTPTNFSLQACVKSPANRVLRWSTRHSVDLLTAVCGDVRLVVHGKSGSTDSELDSKMTLTNPWETSGSVLSVADTGLSCKLNSGERGILSFPFLFSFLSFHALPFRSLLHPFPALLPHFLLSPTPKFQLGG